MDTDRKLGEVAANLDDISDSIEELKDAAHEADSPSEGALDDLQQDVKDASDAIDEVVDPEQPPNPNPAGSAGGRVGADALATRLALRIWRMTGPCKLETGVRIHRFESCHPTN